jgi:hypothetical protein
MNLQNDSQMIPTTTYDPVSLLPPIGKRACRPSVPHFEQLHQTCRPVEPGQPSVSFRFIPVFFFFFFFWVVIFETGEQKLVLWPVLLHQRPFLTLWIHTFPIDPVPLLPLTSHNYGLSGPVQNPETALDCPIWQYPDETAI